MLEDLWSRISSAQPPLSWEISVLLALVALAVTWTPAGYRVVRHVVTLMHEAGHASAAVLCGRRLTGIRLHSDTSGVTLSRGRPRGPGMVLTLLAGYPAPALVGLLGAMIVSSGHAAACLWAVVALCVLMLALIRNLYGAVVVLVIGISVGTLSWLAPGAVISVAAHLVVWSLLLAAPRAVVELGRRRRRGARGSDADQLAGITGLPAGVWVAVFWLACVAPLAYAVYRLIPVAS